MKELPGDYRPFIFDTRLFCYWWVVILCMICGAGLGYIFSHFNSPIYEAVFQVSTNANLENNPNNTQYMVDISILHVGELVFLPETLDQVVVAEQGLGITLTVDELRHVASVERRGTLTLLKVRWNDPATASQIANTWGRIYFEALQKGYQQALLAENLSTYQTSLENCLTITMDTPTIKMYCGFTQAGLAEEIARNAEAIYLAKSQSLGLYADLYVNEYQDAALPSEPLVYQRGKLVLAGSLAGLLIAILIIEVFLLRNRPPDDR